jgi:2-oxoglutarate dehydrogenase E2 component (dihydrolipoamide succinyltransferase)
MSIEVKVPVLPESVEDATIATWHRQPGDVVRRDDSLVDLETDKVVLEVPAPVDGTLKEIKAPEGEIVHSDELLAIIEEGAVEPEVQAEPEPELEPETEPGSQAELDSAKLSPAARRVAEEEKVDPGSVPGTGRGGRITKGDVIKFIKGGGSRLEERVKMTRLRSRIAERMKDAQNTAAILTSFNEVDLKAVMDLRRKYQEQFVEQHGIKLGLMSFFVKACCDSPLTVA